MALNEAPGLRPPDIIALVLEHREDVVENLHKEDDPGHPILAVAARQQYMYVRIIVPLLDNYPSVKPGTVRKQVGPGAVGEKPVEFVE